MIRLGLKYIKIFKKTFYHPFINHDLAYKQLSLNRQSYSNAIVDFLNLDINLIGEIPKLNKKLYTINHRSLLDIIVMEHIFSLHNKNGAWIAKQDLFDAFYGKFFKYSGCISVDVKNKKGLLKFFKTIRHSLNKVDDLNIYIFPEGERNKKNGIKEFQNGAAKIAIANKLDIVPVYIDCKLENIFKNSPFNNKKSIDIYIGDTIEAKNLQDGYKNFIKKVTNG